MARQTRDDDTDTDLTYEQMLENEDIQEPSRLASGQWILRCTAAKHAKLDEPSDDGTKGIVTLVHTPVRPGDNVDTDKVEDGGWRGKRLFTRFFIHDAGDLFNVRKAVEGHGVSMDGRKLLVALPLIRGRTTEATIGVRSFKRKDGTTGVDNTVSNFVPA